jgi:hypothetical protein
MSVREAIAKNPTTTTIVTLVVLAGTIVYCLHGISSASGTASNQAYFTTDDGQSFFVDSMDHLPPFDREGKPAYRVWMYSCDGGVTKFPGYLERLTPQGLARMEPELADYKSGKTRVPPGVGPTDIEVKKPGPGNSWVNRANYQEAQKITVVQCPAGTGSPEVQLP